MKRFYRQATIDRSDQGHRVLLDGRPLRTPARQPLVSPTSDLAQAIAAEWQAQGEMIQPAALPLTKLASTALDRLPGLRAAAIEEAVGYAGTDLLCYRASEPLKLVRRQRRAWQPLLDWAAVTYGARLTVTTSILPVEQPAPALQRLRDTVEGLPDWTLVGVHAATTALGSLIVGLALLCRRVDVEQALAVSLLDELFEIERWGLDAEAERRHAALRVDIEAAAAFLERLDTPPPAPSGPPTAS
jgi:chaperone required for assembly of F1-ATPase